MLRYYSCYSFGGFKDFYLGSNADTFESSYFFNLLPVWERRATEENDEQSRAKVSACKQLPLIQVINTDNNFGMPKSGDVIFTHAGYKLIYEHLEDEIFALSVRDIESIDGGRNVPFLFVITSDSDADLPLMDKLAAYAASHLQTYGEFIDSVIGYDAVKNGLRFDVGKFNEWVQRIARNNDSSVKIPLVSQDLIVKGRPNAVSALVIPDGIPLATVEKEQNLFNKKIESCYLSEILPIDDIAQTTNAIRGYYEKKHKQDAAIAHKKLMKYAAAAAIAGFIVGFVLSRMTGD